MTEFLSTAENLVLGPYWKKHCQEPYLTHLINGTKTVEGRLYKGDWRNIKLDDTIHFYNEEKGADFHVTGLTHVKDFGQLYCMCEEKLLPGIYFPHDAKDIYNRWFSDEDIEKYGVVGIQVRKIDTSQSL
jgi:ASC-1-like (ASCH) protein